MNRMKILSILTYISRIENLTDFECHYKLHEKNSLYREEIVSRIKQIYDNHSDVSCEIDYWFCKLPFTVQMKILNHLDHYSLINFAYGIPSYIDIITHPQFWKHLEFTLAAHIINNEGLIFLLDYLNNNLRKLSIDLTAYKDINFYEILKLIPNLDHLYICCQFPIDSPIINDVCNSMNNLTQFGVKWPYFNNHHLILLVNRFSNLNEITVLTIQDVDYACFYMFKKLKKIIKLHLNLPYLSNQSMNVLCERHGNELRDLRLNLFIRELFDQMLVFNIKRLNKLDSIRLENLIVNDQILQMLSELKTIRKFVLTYTYDIPVVYVDINEIIFSQPRKSLNFLLLDNTYLTDTGLDALIKNVEEIEEARLFDCLITENALEKVFKEMNVKRLFITSSKYSMYSILLDFLNESPDIYLINTAELHLELIVHESLIPRVMNNIKTFLDYRKNLKLEFCFNSIYYNFS